MPETIQKTEIQTELVNRQNALDTQISHLDQFIIDLTSHKIALENANRQIEKMAMAETDVTKRVKFYTSIRMNIELLTKVFDSISKLETIKHNYHKEIDEVIEGKIRLVAVDIRKIDEAIKDGSGDLTLFFEKLGNALSNLGKGANIPAAPSLNTDPEYKL